jgi:hypothetical protein
MASGPDDVCSQGKIGSGRPTNKMTRFVDNVIEAPFGQCLLLGANAHFKHLFNGSDPLGMGLDERIVLQRVFRALDIGR